MKPFLFSIAFALITCSFTLGSGPLKPYKEKKFTWYGVDFRLARFIGPDGFKDPVSIEMNAMRKWNNVILDERDKYDIKKALKVKNYGYKIEWMVGMNEQVDVASIIQYDSHSVTKDQLKNHIAEYHGAEGDGVGIVFVVESFNKLEKTGYIWVTFFDEATKEIILTERMSGPARGLSFANYWCGSLHSVIEQMKDTKRKMWFSKK